VLSDIDIFDPERREFGPAERRREAQQKDRPVSDPGAGPRKRPRHCSELFDGKRPLPDRRGPEHAPSAPEGLPHHLRGGRIGLVIVEISAADRGEMLGRNYFRLCIQSGKARIESSTTESIRTPRTPGLVFSRSDGQDSWRLLSSERTIEPLFQHCCRMSAIDPLTDGGSAGQEARYAMTGLWCGPRARSKGCSKTDL
jgi:hypothetical protein